ncbi:MAG: DUF3135 domain-containing protein [Candidatus Thiodiazotropha lotti]|nr:DUF3135 domain-containing protein [Candidatus Thiodiazotropha lotti]
MKFEAVRQKTIDTYIATLPNERQTQMRRLQWRIDQERRNRSPLSACMRISGLMWDNMLGPKGMLGYLRSINSEPGMGRNRVSSCEIVEFPLGSS